MKILNWRDHYQRINAINSILGSKVLENISRSQIEYCSYDDLDWLDNYFDFGVLKKSFLERFESIKCFHACSPTNIESYLNDGFTGGNHERSITVFNDIFSDVPKSYREKAIAEKSKTREHEILQTHFLCDWKLLVERDGNFLIYGSEFLSALATNLSVQRVSNEDFKQRLKGIGIPTIIEVTIDFSLLEGSKIDWLINYSLADWVNYHLFNEDFVPSEVSIIINQKLPASVIVNHWHPEKIHDSYNYGDWYIPEKKRCYACKEL